MAQSSHKIVVWERLSNGRIVSGSYSSDKIVTVQTAHSDKSLPLGCSTPRDLAIIMLRELAVDGKN
jgi:hypothetical protein